MQLFTATFIKYYAKCKSAIKNTCLKTILIQFCSLWWPIRTEQWPKSNCRNDPAKHQSRTAPQVVK